MKMARAGDIEMSNEVADLVIRNLEDLSAWIDFLKEKRSKESAKKRMLPTDRMKTMDFSGEIALSLAAEKVANRDFLQRLASLAEFRDSASGNHIVRVGLYANKVSEMLDLPMTFIDKITFASTLHDIGKMGVPAAILFKEKTLSAEETDILKEHTTIGRRLLGNSPVAPAADGSRDCPDTPRKLGRQRISARPARQADSACRSHCEGL